MSRRLFLQQSLWGAAAVVGMPGIGVTESTQPSKEQLPDLGVNGRLYGRVVFPPDNPWNQDISKSPVDANSNKLIASIGADRKLHPDFGTFWDGRPSGFQYLVVDGQEPRLPVEFEYADESEPGPYPIPLTAPIEGGPTAPNDADRHVLVIDREAWKLYEMFHCFPGQAGWKAGSGAIFDLQSGALRPAGWTSADAAGLPIFPGLVRYEEVFETGAIPHALRFTCRKTRRAYVSPARHFASPHKDENLPPLGMRVRLKGDFNIARFPAPCQVILKCMQTYGMLLADNGSDWFFSGAHDPRWNDDEIGQLKRLKGSDFEVVQMGELTTG